MQDELLKILIMFAVYALMGWMAEVVFFTLKTGKFVNRGFLNGPLCPLYGFGVVGVVIIMSPVSDNIILLFLGSAIFCTVVELIAGIILRRLFHDRWWDYSGEPFNFRGYICLRFSIMWGIACAGVIRVVHPAVCAMIEIMPQWLEIALVCVFYAYTAADLIVTVRGINRVNRGLREMAEQSKAVSDATGYLISEAAKTVDEKTTEFKEELDEKVDELKEKKDVRMDAFIAFATKPELANHRRLLRAFPALRENFKERIIREVGEDLREVIEDFFKSS